MFQLNDKQRALLAAARAWQEDGERRFDFWSQREALGAATQTFRRVLGESGLASGRRLTDDARARLLRVAALLSPNANLSRRLFAHDPTDFDRRLRALLASAQPLPERLATFLSVRGAGALTAAQLLCASAPETFPLLSRLALRRLHLTAAQKREAVRQAAERYGFEAAGRPDAVQGLLGLFVVYEAVRDALRTSFYPEIDALLRADWALLPTAGEMAPIRAVREPSAGYEAPPASPTLTETALLGGLEEWALGQGFVFPPHLLRSYYIALKTKPFAILSGVSGTGKTKMAELLAEGLTGHHPTQFRLIPVRPDWADSTPLFGYHNVLANRYVSTPFLEIARAAGLPENRDKAYFVCLDEMNLSRVEHYLADYLSALESRARRIPLHEDVPDLALPNNLFLTGTVNVDETTHAFSRKVLDRANTLDFDAPPRLTELTGVHKGVADLSAELGDATPAERQRVFLQGRIGHVGRARERLAQIGADFPGRALAILQAINDRLYPHRLHFAYRVRDDVLLFLANSFDAETGQGLLLPDTDENFALALDLQIHQKALPKLNGVAEQLDALLSDLHAWAEAEALPRTAQKLARMRAHGAATGYVRFYE